MGFHRIGTGIESAMLRGRAKSHKHSSIKTGSRDPVADALFRLWRCGLDGLAKFLKRNPFVIAQGREKLITFLAGVLGLAAIVRTPLIGIVNHVAQNL